MPNKLRVGLLGCGAIASGIATAIKKGKLKGISITAVFDYNKNTVSNFSRKFNVRSTKNTKELSSKSDVVVEAASQQAVMEYGKGILLSCDLMIMSVGALTEPKLLRSLKTAAKKNKNRIWVPSGAVCGIDCAKAVSLGKIETAQLTTTKPSKALPVNVKKRTIVFDGWANAASKEFPKNINVAAVVQLALGKPLRVKIISDPKARRNTHELFLKGEFGELRTQLQNVPSADNPKTSRMAIYSALAVLKRMSETIQIGN
ncbi:MAG: aspartate dehydrogenase [Candidatus Micrarchaeota archaeon]